MTVCVAKSYCDLKEFIYLTVFIFVNKDFSVQRSQMLRELSELVAQKPLIPLESVKPPMELMSTF